MFMCVRVLVGSKRVDIYSSTLFCGEGREFMILVFDSDGIW